MPDVGDAKTYMAGAIAIIAEYPQAVMDKIADPRTGTRVLKDFPSLASIRKACDELNEPFEREAERKRAHDDARPVALRKLRTPEEQAAAEAQVEAVRKQLGIPPNGLPPRSVQVPGMAPISIERVRAVIADCEARRARRGS